MFGIWKRKIKGHVIYAPLTGRLVPLENVPDSAFRNRQLGDGIAIEPDEDVLRSPVEGEIKMIFPTGHAIGIVGSHGEEVLDQLKYFYGTGVETVESVPAVLAVITLAQGDPLTAISIAAELGADTDTIAAICGAICGCMHPDFPEEMICQLEEVNQLDFENLAQRLEPYVVENEV